MWRPHPGAPVEPIPEDWFGEEEDDVDERKEHTEVDQNTKVTDEGVERNTEVERTVTEPAPAKPEPGVDTPVQADPDLTDGDSTKAAQ